MEEELLKRSTDCVYFLASPLTCKKGIECEYRHNDIARLNPRECWFWLAGSCLNPTCGFRHPPLETFAETSYKVTTTYDKSVALMSKKTRVPCFFYHNGFCSKGEKCVFQHGPGDVIARNSSRVTSGVTDELAAAPEMKKKELSVGIEIVSVPLETHPGFCAEIAANGNIKTQVNLHQTTNDLTVENFSESHAPETELESSFPAHDSFPAGGRHSDIAWSSDDEMEEKEEGLEACPCFENHVPETELESSFPAHDSFPAGGRHSDTAWSSDDEMEEKEEGLEARPCFDVLFNDDRSKELMYDEEEDNEYLIQNQYHAIHVDEQYVGGYDFDDSNEHNPVHADEGLVFEEEASRVSYYERATGDFLRKPNGNARSRDCILHNQNRKIKLTEWGGFNFKGADLRHYHYYPRKHVYSWNQHPHLYSTRRAASKLEISATGSLQLGCRASLNGFRRHRGTSRHIHMMSSQMEEHFKRRRGKQLPPFQSQRVSGIGGYCLKRKSSNMFIAPKTLSQIKEEKKRAKWAVSFVARPTGLEDEFQGPKSLAEILKDKRR
ncbi:unnamed protein product [Cuscuta epithymum]|nr:unnamed protein product [Cuscuta epithymum]